MPHKYAFIEKELKLLAEWVVQYSVPLLLVTSWVLLPIFAEQPEPEAPITRWSRDTRHRVVDVNAAHGLDGQVSHWVIEQSASVVGFFFALYSILDIL